MVDLSERGLRNPRHGFAVTTNSRLLQPIFAAPVRPMETVVGWRIQLDAMITQMCKIAWLPPTDIEIGIWKVPLSTLGDYFTDLFVADFEDEADAIASGSSVLGTGVVHAGTPVSEQGPRSQAPLHTRTRHWAGEYGSTSAALSFDQAKAFAPYVSAATYHVARSFYEMELEIGNSSPSSIGGFPRNDDDLWQLPPVISERIRSMTGSAMGQGEGSDVIPTATLAEWAERLSLLSRPNRTYREYLQGFGVPDSRIATLPEPLTVIRRMLRPTTPLVVGGLIQTAADQSGVADRYSPSGLWATNHTESGNNNTLGGDAGFAMIRANVDETRGRRLMIDEPSILLGTVLFNQMPTRPTSFAHHMDVTRLISAAMWGDAMPDEMDFVTAQDVVGSSTMSGIPGRPSGTESIFTGRNDDGQNSPFVMNALNLFLNGDYFCNDTFAFGTYGIGGTTQETYANETLPAQYMSEVSGELAFNALGQFSVGVATDLVS